MIEVFEQVDQNVLAEVLNAALSNENNKIYVEAVGVKDSEIVTIKRMFNSFHGDTHIDKMKNLEDEIEKYKLFEVKIIIRSADQKVRIFHI